MATRVRAFDWAATPLGPIETWPASLRHMVEFMLASPELASVAVGPQRILIYNDMAAARYGAHHPRALGRPLADTFDDYPEVEGFYDRAFAGESLHVPAQPLDPSGEHRDEVYEAFLTPIRDEADMVVAVHMSGIARGGQARAEAALRESEARYRSIFASLADGFYLAEAIFDADGTCVDLRYHDENAAAVRMTGQSFKGRLLSELGGYEPYWYEIFGDTAKTGTPHDAELFAAPDGIWYSFHTFKPPGARANELVVVFSDVTVQHQLAESEAMRRVALSGGRMGSWRWDRAADRIQGDAQFMALWGLPPSDEPLPLATFAARMTPAGAADMAAIVARAVAAGEDFSGPLEIVAGPTAGHWVQWQGRAAADDPAVLYGVTYDITGQKAVEARLRDSEERQRFLLALSDALRPLSEPETIQHEAMELLGERLGVSRAQYYIADETGEYLSSSGGYTDGVPAATGSFRLIEFGRYAYDGFHAGQTQVVCNARTDPRITDAVLRSYETVGFLAFIGVPFVQRGRLLGTIAVHQSGPRQWTDAERMMVEETAQRAGIAIEQARAETALRESEDRQAFLLTLSDALRPLADTADIQGETTRLLREQLDAGWCYYVDWDVDRGTGIVLRDSARDGLPSLAGVHDVSDAPEFLQLLAADAVLTVHDYANFEQLPARIRRNFTASGFRSMIAAPLVKQGRLIATLIVGDTKVRDWTAGETALLVEAAERTWAAVERAHAEATLRESEEKYRTLFESIDDGLAIVEMIYDGRGEIVDMIFRQVNRAYERQGGVYDVVGRSIHDVLPGVEDIWLDRYKQAAITGEPIQVEDYQQDVDRWFDVRFTRVDDAGRFVAIVFNDITERKLTEIAQGQSQERQAFLLKFGDALRAEADAGEIELRAVQLLANELRLDRCYIVATRLDEDLWDVRGEYRVSSLPAMPPVLDQREFREALRLITEQTLVIDDTATQAGFSDVERTGLQALGFGALLMAVLREGDRKPAWSLVASFAQPHHWTPGEIALVEETAERTWAAIERARAETALRESERRLQTLIDGVPQLVWRASDPGHWTWASPQWTAYTGQAEADSHGWGWLDPVHPDDRERVRTVWAGAVERGEFHADYRLCHIGEQRYRWFQTRATPVRDDAGRIVEWLGTSTDVDDLRGLQERQQVLVAELQHRTRNLMGVVRSTADRTGERSADVADFRRRFQDRLEALARVQGLLSRLNDTDRIAFDELIRTELAAMNGDAERVTLDGPPGIRLRSSMVQTLAMALHELATNAVKYGALGQSDGRLAISWRMIEPDRRGRPRLRIEWRESGVTMPAPGAAPQGGGQGRELIERALPYQLGAETSFALEPDGVRCTIVIPVSASIAAETING